MSNLIHHRRLPELQIGSIYLVWVAMETMPKKRYADEGMSNLQISDSIH